MTQFACCGHCGNAFADDKRITQLCLKCNKTTFVSPSPVAVACVPVEDRGWILVRRAFDPAKGTLCFPGGYVEKQEHWADAAAREFQEETGYTKQLVDLRLVEVYTAEHALLLFGLSEPISFADFRSLGPTAETTEVVLIDREFECGFQSHTHVLDRLVSDRFQGLGHNFIIR